MIRASSNRLLRIPVSCVDGHWETKLGGPIPAKDGAGRSANARSAVNLRQGVS